VICPPCRTNTHEECTDLPRQAAFKAGKIKGMTDGAASRWCDCGHVTSTDLSKVGVKAVVEC
jgi:hypothetical protein